MMISKKLDFINNQNSQLISITDNIKTKNNKFGQDKEQFMKTKGH